LVLVDQTVLIVGGVVVDQVGLEATVDRIKLSVIGEFRWWVDLNLWRTWDFDGSNHWMNLETSCLDGHVVFVELERTRSIVDSSVVGGYYYCTARGAHRIMIHVASWSI
jgi:hypothetical protein